MGTAVILVVLVIIVVFAVRSGIKHGKGEGGCCGGGSSVKEEKKVLTGDIIATKIVSIEGMHCENCKNSIEHQINRIDGASCEVNLKKKTAVIKLDKPVESPRIFGPKIFPSNCCKSRMKKLIRIVPEWNVKG